MSLIIVYVALLFVGQSLAIGVGMVVDNISQALGLFVFLALYFGVFVACWKLAVWLTGPKGLLSGLLGARLGR
jgi:hypothetical protein